MHIALVVFVGLVAGLGIDVKFAHSQTKEAGALSAQFTKLYQQGRYSEAIPLAQRILAILEKSLGPNDPRIATSLNDLAVVYQDQGRSADAEPLFKRALAIREKALGPNHPDVAQSLNSLAELYKDQGRYADAEQLYKRSLAIREKALGPNHPDVATSLSNLAGLYQAQGRYADAEPLLKRTLAIQEKALGPDHPDVARSLNNVAALYKDQGRYADAEPLYKRSLAIWEKALGPNHPNVANSLNNLASLYDHQGRYADAEPLYKRALTINEKSLGPNHPNVAGSLNNLAGLYQAQGRYADAEPLLKQALAIREKSLGPDHPDVAGSLNNVAELYKDQGRYADAEPLYTRSLAIWEKALGPEHPNVATSLSNLAGLYQAQGRYADAEPLLKRALAIQEKALGPDHPDVARSLNNLATLFTAEGRYADALPIVQRTIAQNYAAKSVALGVLHGSQSQNLITPTQALNLSYAVLQHSVSSAAGEAISTLAARFAAGSDELAQLVRKVQDLTAEADRLDKNIIAAVSKPPAERNTAIEDQIRKRVEEIKSERDKIQDVFSQRFPDYVALLKPQPLTVEQTQAPLADDEAIVAVDLDKKSYVWVITKDRADWKELSVSAEDVSKDVGILRTGLNPDSPKPFDRSLAYQLYRKVLGPIEEIISQKTRLSFVLDGALTSLPPQVLVTRDPTNKDLKSTDWLIRRNAIAILPSVYSLKVLREKSSKVAVAKPLIGFGDPVFQRGGTAIGARIASNRGYASFYRAGTADLEVLAKALPPLPETADELRAVAKSLGAGEADLKLGSAATVTAVKQTKLDQYRIVYFATHALVSGETEQAAKGLAEPALVLSLPVTATAFDDGLLTSSDVAQLKLNADWVVLSACNTAAAEKPGAEALSGLARAFFYAGAHALLVSHWPVESEPAVKLMTTIFAAIADNPKLTTVEALRQAMLATMDDRTNPEWANPTSWSPFVLVGEGGAMTK